MTDAAPVVVILTALQVEYEAVRVRVTDVTRERHGGTIFELGRLPGTGWSVVLAQTGPGNESAALVTQQAYDAYRPRLVLFVGVAGGLKDQVRIGDVVIGERIYDYREKQDPGGAHFRPRDWETQYWLVQHVQRMSFGPEVGRVRVAPIASGNVVLDKKEAELSALLRGNYDDALAIEMESAGMCRAAHHIGRLDTLTIRGISDMADGGKRLADAGSSQEFAAWRAAAAAGNVLASLLPDRDTDTEPSGGLPPLSRSGTGELGSRGFGSGGGSGAAHGLGAVSSLGPGSGSGAGAGSGVAPDSGVLSGAGPGFDGGVATASEAAPGSGSGPGSGAGTDSGAARNTGMAPGAGMPPGSVAGPGSAMVSGSETASSPGSGIGSGTGTGSGAAPDSGMETGPGTGAGPGMVTGPGAAPDSGSRNGSGAEPGSGVAPGSGSATGSGTESSQGAEPDSGTVTGSGARRSAWRRVRRPRPRPPRPSWGAVFVRPPTRMSGRRRAALTTFVAVVLVAALGAVLMKSLPGSGTPADAKPSGLPSCAASRAQDTLHVSASIDLSLSLAEAADQYGTRRSSDGTCVKVEVSSVNSGTAMRALARGWAEDDGRPDVWSPAGAEWLSLARARANGAAKKLLPETAQPLVTSPLTIAMPKPMAEALGWPEKTVGWQDLATWARDPAHFWARRGQKQWGSLKLGKTNPEYSTSGLNATVGAFYAKTGTSAELSLRDIESADNQAFVKNIEKSVVHYGDTTLTFLANLRAADDKGGADEVRKYISAVTVEESAVVAYNTGYPCGAYSTEHGCEKRSRPRTPLVSFYPKETNPLSDHPYVQLTDLSTAKQQVSKDFLRYLHSPAAYQKFFAPYGYRTWQGKVEAQGINQKNGALKETVSGYTPPDGKVLYRVQSVWSSLRRRANVLVVIDTSKSMDEPVPGTGKTKMELLREAKSSLFHGFADTDRVGLWKFSNAASLDGEHHYVPLVDIGPMGEKPPGRHGATRRQELVDEVDGLVPDGATGLYGTVDAAVDSMRRDYDPDAINAIVFLTDGRNEGVPREPTLQEVLARIGSPDKRVRVFTVAYGSKADQDDKNGKSVLEEIAAATGARAYDAKNPKIISQVLASVISNF
ncbi:substrate-binding domain-containing protein [Streptomyces sp. NPDC051636]|uniref:phosphorylase family protein n=1 Tax=Streptomyces sp. NPDC051636 TaxID=3365663 RepID=UPI0037B52B62